MPNRPQQKSVSLTDKSSKHKAKRWITSLVLFPLILFIALALAIAYRIHAANNEAGYSHLPRFQKPINTTSILIFSPHPDDETLGTSGLIQETVRAGGTAHVVFMTNGDAFRVGVASYYRIFQVRPSDYIKYGEMRQKEALGSLTTLGMSPKNVTFLGYPDLGMMEMWQTHWLPGGPYTSNYSKATLNPYPNAPTYGKPYCGQNVLADIETQIIADRPTDIYTTHPTDNHPDHTATSSFVFTAIKKLEADGYTWAYGIHLHYFIIHRGDWPIPQGSYPKRPLGPPAAFTPLDTHWRSLPLTAAEVSTKAHALDHYVSQEEMMDRFLVSFIRTNEIFGELSESSEQALDSDGLSNSLTANPITWPQCTPVAKDPVGDTDLRVFQPGGDISSVYAAYDKNNLIIRVEMHSKLSKTVTYQLAFRPFDSAMNTTSQVQTFSFSPADLNEGVTKQLGNGTRINWSGNNAEYVIPVTSLGEPHVRLVLAQAKTVFSQITIDHTGYRPIFLPQTPHTTPLP
jgi:LmbE family N-acetylglucosaminyl deacetylase